MKKTLITLFFSCFCCIFLILLLFYSKECIALASNGLLIWYRNMVPSLFPFMVLSGFMIRCGLSVKIGQWLQPVLGILFRLPSQMLYAVFMGFLCGFPMGAKIVTDMLEKKQITKKEGEYLLAFCNNIGPLYMLGYVIPLFDYKNSWKILGLMYLIPFGYGLVLRYYSSAFSTFFNSKSTCKNKIRFLSFFKTNISSSKNTSYNLCACSYPTDNCTSPNYLACFQQSLSSAIEQITMLGGCMIFFNCLLIFPQMLETLLSKTSFNSAFSLLTAVLSSLIEIGGGLHQLASVFNLANGNIDSQHFASYFVLSNFSIKFYHLTSSALTNLNEIHIYLPLALLTFGGLSCITQTCFILKNTGLKISTYIKHKFVQACIFILFVFIL